MKNSSLKTSLDYVFLGGIATSAMDTLAVGPTLIAYALLFGAGDISIGLLGAIPFIGNLIHLFVSWLIEKGYSAKKISLYSSFLSRPFYLIAALLAFWHQEVWALPCLILSLLGAYLIGSMTGGAWLPWMKALVPPHLIGRFFSHRFKWMMVAKIICFIFAFILVKYAKPFTNGELFSYAFLLFLAFLIGLYASYTFIHVEDKPILYQKEKSFLNKVFHTFRNKPFAKLLSALSVLNFSINFLTPFLTVFMLKKLNIDMSTIIMLTLLQWIIYTIIIKRWGKLSDQKGPEKILISAIPLFILCILFFIFLNMFSVSPISLNIILIGVNILIGIATAALTLGINNVSLLYIPKETASVYLAVNSVAKSFAGALGSIVAGVSFILFNALGELSHIKNVTDYSWNLFFISTILLCLLSVVLLKQVKKC